MAVKLSCPTLRGALYFVYIKELTCASDFLRNRHGGNCPAFARIIAGAVDEKLIVRHFTGVGVVAAFAPECGDEPKSLCLVWGRVASAKIDDDAGVGLCGPDEIGNLTALVGAAEIAPSGTVENAFGARRGEPGGVRGGEF